MSSQIISIRFLLHATVLLIVVNVALVSAAGYGYPSVSRGYGYGPVSNGYGHDLGFDASRNGGNLGSDTSGTFNRPRTTRRPNRRRTTTTRRPPTDDPNTDIQDLNERLHNRVRRLHGVEPLQRSDELAELANECAQYYLEIGQINHKCPVKGNAGENLYYQSVSGNVQTPTDPEIVRDVLRNWYSEERIHDYNGGYDNKTGHFTQMVWADSQQVGFGIASSDDGTTVGVALYDPAGNNGGVREFQRNVFPPGNN